MIYRYFKKQINKKLIWSHELMKNRMYEANWGIEVDRTVFSNWRIVQNEKVVVVNVQNSCEGAVQVWAIKSSNKYLKE